MSPPTLAERTAAVLRHVRLGPYVHRLARDEDESADPSVADGEARADELAIELLAPRDDWAWSIGSAHAPLAASLARPSPATRASLTVAQVGVCLTSYSGGHGQWMHRMYRRNPRGRGADPVDEAMRLIQNRHERSSLNQPGGPRDPLNELLRRGIMTYAERAVLTRKSDRPWRMGHGHPAPYELLSRAGHMGLLTAALDVLSELILDQKRFVFVPSEPAERGLLTLGQALRPMEFAVVESAEMRLADAIDRSHLRDPFREMASNFVYDAGRCIYLGVYRTFAEAPPQLFYAHRDHVHEAALIAMADSLMQPHRNFPALIDLADIACRGLFGAEGFHSAVESAYARRGRPLAYLSERATRG